MELSKAQRLHDTLKKLAPKGNHGGLGSSGLVVGGFKHRDNGLPKNGLYSYFVKPGHFKTVFSDSDEEEDGAQRGEETKNGKANNESSGTNKSEKKLKRRQEKEARKADKAKRKLAKEATRADAGEAKHEEKANGDGPEMGEPVPEKAEERAAKRERKTKRKRATGSEESGYGEAATADSSGAKTNDAKKLSKRNSKVRNGGEKPASDPPAPAVGAVDAAPREGSLDGSAKKMKKRKRARVESATETGPKPENASPVEEERASKDGTKKRKKKDKSRPPDSVDMGEETAVRKASEESPAVPSKKDKTKRLGAEKERETRIEKPTPKKAKRKARKDGEASEANGTARRNGELTANGTGGSSPSDTAPVNKQELANGHPDEEAGAVREGATRKKKAKKTRKKDSLGEGSAATEEMKEEPVLEAVSEAGKKKETTKGKVLGSSSPGADDGESLVTAEGSKKRKKTRKQEQTKGPVAEDTVVSSSKVKRKRKSEAST